MRFIYLFSFLIAFSSPSWALDEVFEARNGPPLLAVAYHGQKRISAYVEQTSSSIDSTPNLELVIQHLHGQKETVALENIFNGNLQFSTDGKYLFVGTTPETIYDLESKKIIPLNVAGFSSWVSNSEFIYVQNSGNQTIVKQYNIETSQSTFWASFNNGSIEKLLQDSVDKKSLYASVFSSGKSLFFKVECQKAFCKKTLVPLREGFRARDFTQTNEYLVVDEQPLNNLWRDRQISIYRKSDYSLVQTIKGLSPVAASNDEFLFVREKGTEETVPLLFNIKTRRTSHITGFGTGPAYVTPIPGATSHDTILIAKKPLFKITAYSVSKNIVTPLVSRSSLKDQNFLSVKTVNFPENKNLPAYLYQNTQKPVQGTLVLLHGGGVNGYSSFDFYREMGRDIFFLTQKGYAVLAISYHGDYPGAGFTETRYFATDEVNDVMNGYQYLLKRFANVPIYLWGFSHGSSLTNFISGYYADSFFWSGIISQSGVWAEDTQQHSYLNSYFEGLGPCAQALQEPIRFAKNIRRPFLQVNSLLDNNTPINTTQDFLAVAKAQNLNVTSVILPDSGHVPTESEKDWKNYRSAFENFIDHNRELVPTAYMTNQAAQNLSQKVESLVTAIEACK
jgi:alpha-beta hydrolase superfamily lysophospholipase